jgi:hypothetical protein
MVKADRVRLRGASARPRCRANAGPDARLAVRRYVPAIPVWLRPQEVHLGKGVNQPYWQPRGWG